MSDTAWFASGAIAFALGFVALLMMRRRGTAGDGGGEPARERTREEENDRVIHALVVLIAGSAYLLMMSGGGQDRSAADHVTYWARYVDWGITTPLLLLGLALTALGERFRKTALVAGLIATDVYMIATGYLADRTVAGDPMKWAWFGLSTGAFLGLYWMVWGPLRREAAALDPERERHYVRNALFLSIIWAFYPFNFLAGPEGMGLITSHSSIAAYAVLDVIAKVAFGFYSLGNRHALVARAIAEGRMTPERAEVLVRPSGR